MKKVLYITSQKNLYVNWVRETLESSGSYHFEIVNSDSLSSSQLSSGTFDFLVFECNWLNEEELQVLKALPPSLKDLPTVILASQITIAVYRQVQAFENMVTLQTPCDEKLLLTVVAKIETTKAIRPEICPRFVTNLPLKVLVLDNGVYLPTRLRNYSATGAFLEYHGISMRVGHRIQINFGKYENGNGLKTWIREAKVVWVRESHKAQCRTRGVGIQFLE